MVIIYSVSHVYCLCYISLNDYFDKVGVRQSLFNLRIEKRLCKQTSFPLNLFTAE